MDHRVRGNRTEWITRPALSYGLPPVSVGPGRPRGRVTRRPGVFRRVSPFEVVRERLEVRTARHRSVIRVVRHDVVVLEPREVVVMESDVDPLSVFVSRVPVHVVRDAFDQRLR